MLLTTTSSPFGSRSRSRILVALHLLGYSYPRALARHLAIPIFAVRKALAALERDGLVSASAVGRTRVYRLDAAYPAHAELAAYLSRLADLDKDLRTRLAGAEGRALEPPPARVAETRAVRTWSSPHPAWDDIGERPTPRAAAEGWRNW